jgi:hypothetical protein
MNLLKKLRLIMGSFSYKMKMLFGIYDKQTLEYAEKALVMSTNLKSILESNFVATISDIIPGDWDNKLIDTAKDSLKKVIPILSIINDCKGNESLDYMINCFISGIKKLPPEMQDAAISKFSSLITRYMHKLSSNKNVDNHYFDTLTQSIYSLSKASLLLLIPFFSFSQTYVSIDTGTNSFRLNSSILPKNSTFITVGRDTGYIQFISSYDGHSVTKQVLSTRVYRPSINDTFSSTSELIVFFQNNCLDTTGLGGGVGGMVNPMTAFGDIIYGGNLGDAQKLSANSSSTKMVLSQKSSGIPYWSSVGKVDSIYSSDNTLTVTSDTLTNAKINLSKSNTWTSDSTVFSNDIKVHGITVGTGQGGISTNTGFGLSVLSNITTGIQQCAFGNGALASVTSSTASNSAFGYLAGNKITTGIDNTYFGASSGGNTSTGVSGHTAIGRQSLNYSTGNNNTAIGSACMSKASSWSGINNVGIGVNILPVITTGSNNLFAGGSNGSLLTSGSSNVGLGLLSIAGVSTTSYNTAVGSISYRIGTGTGNTCIGYNSGSSITTGNYNTVIGSFTGSGGGIDITTSSNNIILSDGQANTRLYFSGANGTVYGNFTLGTAGNKISITTGTNASAGTSSAMVSGTTTISTTAVTSNSIILLTGVSTSTPCATCGALSQGTIVAGTSFVINSSLNTDTRVVKWVIIN